ncbi:MAG: hypothetical protein CV089_23990 [Nitrospira sp. WS110]|nr:hypothetical protein [Nitrospira sp. WS110]
MPVDSDPNDGFTESAQKKDPVVASDIARNMQECLVRVPIHTISCGHYLAERMPKKWAVWQINTSLVQDFVKMAICSQGYPQKMWSKNFYANPLSFLVGRQHVMPLARSRSLESERRDHR